jgi:DNA repair exonuclease SbcCD nuclease subunit
LKVGLISDIHAGYVRGTRDNADGVNVREQDVLDAATAAVHNLMRAGVEAIVDLGDLFHVPAPKKRALVHMVNLIEESGLPWFSANGNHTLQRTKSDLHVYDVLYELTTRFTGYVEPTLTPFGAYLIPYGTEVEALKSVPSDALFIAGHFACDDVPWPGEHVSVKDLNFWPVFLGHYHTRSFNRTPDESWEGPMYIGATERFAWGEANNPTGAAVFDTEAKTIDFLDHETREWVDVSSGPERVLDDLRTRDLEGRIVRVSVEATPPEYHGLDIKSIRDVARSALEFQIRRSGSSEAFAPTEHTDTQTYSLLDAWEKHVRDMAAASWLRKEVERIGLRALASAGVGE